MLQFSKEDLNLPQFLVFKEGSEVQFRILPEPKRNEGILSMHLEILSEEHKGKTHVLRLKEEYKHQIVPFLQAFFSDEQLMSGVNESSLVMKKGTCKAGKINQQGYQNLTTFKESKIDDIAF